MSPEAIASQGSFAPELRELEESLQGVSLCEVLDRVLNKGIVVAGEVIISLAGVDLVYLGLNLVLTSIEPARGSLMTVRTSCPSPFFTLSGFNSRRSRQGVPLGARGCILAS